MIFLYDAFENRFNLSATFSVMSNSGHDMKTIHVVEVNDAKKPLFPKISINHFRVRHNS